LLVLVISMGVVAMHSVVGVGACSGEGHGGGHAMSASADDGFGGAHHAGHPGPAGSSASLTGARGATATAPHDGHGTDGCSMLGHLCLAILNALGLVLVLGLIMMAAIGRRSGGTTASGAAVRGARAPPADRPPSGTSLTELCVSRR
jgi:hypothetical protein